MLVGATVMVAHGRTDRSTYDVDIEAELRFRSYSDGETAFNSCRDIKTKS